MEKLSQAIIIILFTLIHFNCCIIVIPFKTYVEKEPETFKPMDVINYWGKNILYSEVLIGTPPQKVTLIIHSKNFGSHLFKNMCDLPNSDFERNKSSTFEYYSDINSYLTIKNVSMINETIYFYDSLKLEKQVPLNFYRIIYTDNDEKDQGDDYEYHNNTCLELGLPLKWENYIDVPTNLINQLRNNFKIIETSDISLKYNSDSDGVIVIGQEPHLYDPENYFEMQYRVDNCYNSYSGEGQYDWLLFHDKSYISYKKEINGTIEIKNESIPLLMGLKIKFDLGMIIGTSYYREMIKKIFFKDLIEEEKCFEEHTKEENKYNDIYVYYCDKKTTEDIIKNEFPTIYFEVKQFNKIFELTYKDLFREKDGKLYFLIYFDSKNYGPFFNVGSIFLKKYFFTFNQESKKIGYYNENLPGGKKQNNKNEEKNLLSNKYLLVAVVIILIIIFGLLGFFVGKLVYDKIRKKRINEIDDDNYDYNPQQDNNEEDKKKGIIIND